MNYEGTGKNKLNSKQKQEVKELIAAYEPLIDIVEHLKTEYDIDISYRAIYFYADHYYQEIKEIREKLNREFESIPIANKFNRIKIRQKLIDDLTEHLWYEKPLLSKGNPVADDNGNPILLKLTGNHDVLNKILDSTQKELEPFKIAPVDPTGENEYTGISEARQEILEELDKLLAGIRSNGSSEILKENKKA